LKNLFACLCALVCVLSGVGPAAAESADSAPPAIQATDPMFAMIVAEDWITLDRLAHQRLAADPLDGVALHALGRRAVDGDVGTEQQRAELMPKIEACIAARPADALCRLAYGQVEGALLSGQSMFDAMGSVSKVLDSFEAAEAADPSNYDARESLITFYIRAPGIVGGSTRKANRQADDYAKLNPDYARLLYALIALEDKELTKAETHLAKVPPNGSDPVLLHLTAKRWLSVGLAHIDEKEYDAGAAALSHAIEHGAPSVAGYAHWGLGHIAQVEGRPDAAIDEFGAFLALVPSASGKQADEARASLRQMGTN
jgi:tetratricopeptide (TPR) repeat protein